MYLEQFHYWYLIIYFIGFGVIVYFGLEASHKWEIKNPNDIGANDPMLGYILAALFWPFIVFCGIIASPFMLIILIIFFYKKKRM
jgi:hypothetical protein